MRIISPMRELYQISLIGTCRNEGGLRYSSGGTLGPPAMGSRHRDVVLVGVILSRWPDASGEEIQRGIALAAEERGDLEKGKTLRAEAQTLLERSRKRLGLKRLGLKRIAGNVQHLATI